MGTYVLEPDSTSSAEEAAQRRSEIERGQVGRNPQPVDVGEASEASTAAGSSCQSILPAFSGYNAWQRWRMRISSKSIIVATSAQASSSLGEEVIILQFDSGVYFGLNGIGGLIWSQIQSPCRVEEILDAVVREYEVDSDSCMQDLVNLLRELHQKGLVEIREETTA